MLIEQLQDWHDDYKRSLDSKSERLLSISDNLDYTIQNISILEKKINAEEDVFNPNESFVQEREELEKLRSERNSLQLESEKYHQNILYLQEKIDVLDNAMKELKFNQKVTVQSDISHWKDKLRFLVDIAESDPRRCKVELLNIIQQL